MRAYLLGMNVWWARFFTVKAQRSDDHKYVHYNIIIHRKNSTCVYEYIYMYTKINMTIKSANCFNFLCKRIIIYLYVQICVKYLCLRVYIHVHMHRYIYINIPVKMCQLLQFPSQKGPLCLGHHPNRLGPSLKRFLCMYVYMRMNVPRCVYACVYF